MLVVIKHIFDKNVDDNPDTGAPDMLHFSYQFNNSTGRNRLFKIHPI